MSESDRRDDEAREVRERLRALRIDPPEGGFSAALHRRLAEAGPPVEPTFWERLRSRLGPRSPWLALGVAAGVGVFLALGVVRDAPRRRPAAGGQAVRGEVLPFTKVAVIRLALTAELAVASADIQVRLPEGLAFWADGKALDQPTFAWTQPLAAGVNEIPIAVRGLHPGRYRVMVRARIDGQQVDHEIAIDVVDG